MTTVLVAGGTGMLGSHIASHLLNQDGVAVRLLSHAGSASDPARRARIDPLVARGATVVGADVLQPESLGSALAGVDVVVSALQGGPDVIVQGQINLAEVAVRSGVRRFLPSDFAIDLFRAPEGAPQFEARKQADTAIDAMDLEVLHVLNGGFMDLMLSPDQPGLVNVDQATVQFWGTGDEVIDLTTLSDTAQFTARLATDESARPGIHTISGAQVSFNTIAQELEKVTGIALRRTSWGSVDELREVIAAKGGAGSWDAVMEWYFLAMLTTPPLSNPANDRYSEIRPVGLPDYLADAYGTTAS